MMSNSIIHQRGAPVVSSPVDWRVTGRSQQQAQNLRHSGPFRTFDTRQEATVPSHMCHSGRSNIEYLKVAEHDLSVYCSNLYEEDGAELERCWLALNFLEEHAINAEESCKVEVINGVVNGIDCQKKDKFLDFIREMVSQGNVKNMAKTLAVLAGAERRQALRQAEEAIGAVVAAAPAADFPSQGDILEGTPAAEALRVHLTDVFQRYDVDHNGKLDAIEFREAMKEMGDELSAQSVKIIFNSLNIHGFVDMPQFVDIVEAEEVRAHSRFSKSLRSMARGTSKWWTEMPSSIDQY